MDRKNMKKLTLPASIVIIIVFLSLTNYAKAAYLWSVEVQSGEITCEGAGFDYRWLSTGKIFELSPDRKRILAYNSLGRLVVKEIDGTLVRLLPDEDYKSASWSHDSKSLVGMVNERIIILSVDENIEKFITNTGFKKGRVPGSLPLRWSPNGKWIALKTPKGLDIIRPDGTEKRSLISISSGGPYLIELAWSSDSKLLAFTLFGEGIDQHKVMDIDSASIIFTADGVRYSVPPQWAPEGRQIAYIQNLKTSALLVTNLDKNETAEVALIHEPHDAYMRWSPDGAYIAVMDEGDADQKDILYNYDIWIVDVKNISKRRLTSTGGVEYLVGWSPDNQKIYYLSKKSPFPLPAREDVVGLLDAALALYKDDRYEEAAELVRAAQLVWAMQHGSTKTDFKLYTWDGDFPSLITQMKRLYSEKDEDFYWAGFEAGNLLESALERQLAFGKRVGYLKKEMPTRTPHNEQDESDFALILDEAKRYYTDGRYNDALLKLTEAFQLLEGRALLIPTNKQELEATDWTWKTDPTFEDHWKFLGMIRNNSSKVFSFYSITAVLYDKNGEIVNTQVIEANPYGIKPRQTKPFSGIVPKVGGEAKTSIHLEYHE